MRQRGLTLVEVLISFSIAVAVGGLLLITLVNSSGLFYKQSSTVSIGLNTNDALAKVRQSIKESNRVAALYTSGSETYTSGATQIVLQVPSLNFENNIIVGVFDYFVFFQDQTKLRFKIFPDPLSSRRTQDQIFSTNVDNLVFKYLNSANPPVEITPITATKVRITLALKQRSGATYESNIATSEANLRND